jgi:TetR/AcrR family transcriptional regulator, lmrAB and yxaGH operons repressor
MSAMPRTSTARAEMVDAARTLFRRNGYNATALSDVLRESGAPRGSVYYHFPGGKEELGREVAALHGADNIALVDRLANETTTADELLSALVALERDQFRASDYQEGCAVAPIVLEMASSTPALSEVARIGYEKMLVALAKRLIEKGIPADAADELAAVTLTGIQGSLVLCRALHDVQPFDALIATVTERARRLTGDA